jgi:hypothetical protein
VIPACQRGEGAVIDIAFEVPVAGNGERHHVLLVPHQPVRRLDRFEHIEHIDFRRQLLESHEVGQMSACCVDGSGLVLSRAPVTRLRSRSRCQPLPEPGAVPESDRSDLGSILIMRATAWHNGGAADAASSYGIKFTKADRDRFFSPGWNDVVIELDGSETTVVRLTPSFWRSCSELRSAAIGTWLLANRAAPWPKSQPPGIAVSHLADNRFSARVLVRRDVL